LRILPAPCKRQAHRPSNQIYTLCCWPFALGVNRTAPTATQLASPVAWIWTSSRRYLAAETRGNIRTPYRTGRFDPKPDPEMIIGILAVQENISRYLWAHFHLGSCRSDHAPMSAREAISWSSVVAARRGQARRSLISQNGVHGLL